MEGEGDCSASVITVDYPELVEGAVEGDRVVLGDGAITLRVDGVDGDGVEATVLTSGRLVGRPGVHVPSERVRLTTPTAHDLELLEVVVAAGVEFVAVSFVRSALDIELVRSAAGDEPPMIVAKIETDPAVLNLSSILGVADAVMVARGDLGIERPLEDVPHVQKHVIRACVEAGVPVITATQMLESMITLDGTDAGRGERRGQRRVRRHRRASCSRARRPSATTLSRWCRRWRASPSGPRWRATTSSGGDGWAGCSGRSPTRVPRRSPRPSPTPRGRRPTTSRRRRSSPPPAAGSTARAMSRFRPSAQLVGVSPVERTVRQLTLSWGVVPLLVDQCDTLDDLVWYSVSAVVDAGLVGPDELVVMLAGSPTWSDGATDVLRIVRIR